MTASTFTGESLPDLLRARAAASPDVAAFWHEVDGTWRSTTWRQFAAQVSRLAAALASRGLAPGTHVGLLFPTCLAWEVVHHAVLAAGGVVVGLEPHDTPERLCWIVGHADVSVLVVADRRLYDRLATASLPDLQLVIFVDEVAVQDPVHEARLVDLTALEIDRPRPADVRADAPATLLYTSGTTGQPKGILYRHEQVVLAIHAITAAYPSIATGARFVCWLPLSNLFQRIMNLAAMQVGGTVYLVANPLEVLRALPVAQPDIFIGVPRFYEKLHEGMRARIAQAPAPMRRLLERTIDLALAAFAARREGRPLRRFDRFCLAVADRLILRRLRAVMGGRIQFMITGSAPTPVRLLAFFHAIGLPLYEAYGMSENVVPIALNRPQAERLGSVGQALEANELRLEEDGELLVRGPGVFRGYYKDERPTLFTDGGFYHTGDYASIDEAGYVTLRGRKSELIKTSAGRRISPRAIEEALETIAGVERAMVVGNGRKCLSAILTVDAAHRTELRQSLQTWTDAILQVQQQLASFDRPAGVLLLGYGFTIESGELTSNLKLRRAAVENQLGAALEALYADIEKSNIPTGVTVQVHAQRKAPAGKAADGLSAG